MLIELYGSILQTPMFHSVVSPILRLTVFIIRAILKAVNTSEMSAYFHQTTRHKKPRTQICLSATTDR